MKCCRYHPRRCPNCVCSLLENLGNIAQNNAIAWLNIGAVRMSDQAVEILITNAIHTAFIKYPEGDGGPNLDYDWIPREQSAIITKAILLDLAANGFKIVKV